MSNTTASTVARRSSVSASRASTPRAAPRATATVTDIGAARPSAQGQAITRTETAASIARSSAGGGATVIQTAKPSAATAITAGTKTAETRSAMRWIGARLRCASATARAMRASAVASPTARASITSAAAPLTVPPVTRSPGVFSTGSGSPVIVDSSIAPRPSTIIPSQGARWPGSRRRRSPGRSSETGTSLSPPSPSSRRAVSGASSSKARMAPPARRRAASSSAWPNSASVAIRAAASNHSGARPASSRDDGGKTPGASMASRLEA